MACTQGGGAPAISAGDGTVTAPVKRVWQPTDLWLLGIVLAIINFWLFAQTLLNVIPGIRASLGVDPTVANLGLGDGAHSGLFIVVFGGLADRAVRPADTGVPRGDPGHDPPVGELLLQRLGPKKPMLLGAGTAAVAILLTSTLSC